MIKTGSDLVAEALKRQGIEDFFYLMGAPMLAVEAACMKLGMRGIDVRHEQAGAMAASAYARLKNCPAVCMSASGPGTTNIITGLAHAWADGTPVVALGGAAPDFTTNRGAFQDIDQISMMKPCTKFAERVHDVHRIPELLNFAIRLAVSGKPGPVYLEFPGDVLYAAVDESKIVWPEPWHNDQRARPAAPTEQVVAITELLKQAQRPVLVSGTGIIWSDAAAELRAFVDTTGIPFYTTPQSRGVIPEDHDFCYPAERSTAFKEADLILIVGTRLNYVISHGAPPRFSRDAKIIRIDIEPQEISTSLRKLDIGIVADAKIALQQLTAAVAEEVSLESYAQWRQRLSEGNLSKAIQQEKRLCDDSTPIHPLRLCKELRDVISRDAILCVDGQEILNYGRQSIPSFVPGHRLNSGVFGTMGVGMPFGIGAKVAKPDAQVVVLHGDGSFGLNAMEFDTAVRHKLALMVVISLNGGWTGDPSGSKPGRDLGYTRFHDVATALGGVGYFVEKPDDIRSTLQRALDDVKAGRTVLVNVVTDWRAQATTAAFTNYST